MDKHQVAKVLEEIGVLLSLQGENPFKVRAFHNAARTLENLDEDLETIVKEERLEELPGIGERIAKKITTLVLTGHLPYYEELKKSTPPGLIELLKIPGMGSKKIKILYECLKIKTVKDLLDACNKGKIAKLKGFGEKMQENILNGISKAKKYSRRILWWNGMNISQTILNTLTKLKGVQNAEVAGSIRRKLETVGDLDFLVASKTPAPIMEWFTTQTWVEKILAKGTTKSSVRLKQGIQADIRVISPEEFAYALLYFTGSKEHNIKLRHLANELGYSLSEYGLEPLGRKQKVSLPKTSLRKPLSEKDVYKILGLQYIPPELREDMGEIEAAKKNKLPTLIEEKDLRGAFHCHTTYSDGHNTLDEMISAANDLKWDYIGIADHSKSSFQANGMDEKKLFEQVKHIQKINKSKKYSTYVFAGVECDILTNGLLDFPDRVLKELDYVVVSIHRSFKLDEKKMTARLIKAIENPYATIVGHVSGRLLLKREPYSLNLKKVIDACIANHKIMEINAHPMRLDMDWRNLHMAIEKGLKCCINPDAHSTGDLQYVKAGVNIARKGWLEKKDVLNTLSLQKMKVYLK